MGEGDVVLEPPLGLGLRDPANDKVDKVQCVPKSVSTAYQHTQGILS